MPPANLSITLDENRLFAPGDVITGSIHGIHPNNYGPVELILQGISKTYIRQGKSSVYDQVSLLNQVGYVSPAQGDQGVRFAFTVPAQVQRYTSTSTRDRRSWSQSWRAVDGFEGDAGHALPPTRTVVLSGAYGSPGGGYIAYIIAARQIQHDGSGKVLAQGERDIALTTARMSAADYRRLQYADSTISTMERVALNVQKAYYRARSRQRSMTENIRNAFTSFPVLRLKAVFTTPSIAAAGRETYLSLRLRTSAETRPNDCPLPPITLKSVNIRLKNVAGVRCQGLFFDAIEYSSQTVDSIRNMDDHVFYPTRDRSEYQDVSYCVRFTVPAMCTPNFQTYNLNTFWYVKGEAVFAYLDQKDTVKFKSEIMLVSAPR
ncbi:hypothetical protein AWENTII_005661 [Aspergillus wentii]|nr:hypothetical protein MW887_000426 [Aspergillus wentii]